MSLARYLARLGYGTRRETEQVLAQRRVTSADGQVLRDRDAFVHEALRVDGIPLDPPPGAVVLLNKPLGYVCSTSDRPPLVYDLFPARFLRRTPVMATVGRLDADTSGVLLLTDDGALNHRLTSPRSHLPKTYEVTLADPLRGDEADRCASGTLLLHGESVPLLPARLMVTGERTATLCLLEGRYHQVRRMFAAMGNHVVSLHRAAFGDLTLGSLAAGAWRVLEPHEVDALRASVAKPRTA
jgi:16S rRNA pseudouridine516 synthase